VFLFLRLFCVAGWLWSLFLTQNLKQKNFCCFNLSQKKLFQFFFKKNVWFAVFYFSCCCGSALFQQQPTGFVEASVCVSAIAV
jgi:hypothetical protein